MHGTKNIHYFIHVLTLPDLINVYRIFFCCFVYATCLPTNAPNKTQASANNKTQFVIRVTPTVALGLSGFCVL